MDRRSLKEVRKAFARRLNALGKVSQWSKLRFVRAISAVAVLPALLATDRPAGLMAGTWEFDTDLVGFSWPSGAGAGREQLRPFANRIAKASTSHSECVQGTEGEFPSLGLSFDRRGKCSFASAKQDRSGRFKAKASCSGYAPVSVNIDAEGNYDAISLNRMLTVRYDIGRGEGRIVAMFETRARRTGDCFATSCADGDCPPPALPRPPFSS